jgi:hypothetical protein
MPYFDDLELQREGEAKLAGRQFKPAAEPSRHLSPALPRNRAEREFWMDSSVGQNRGKLGHAI